MKLKPFKYYFIIRTDSVGLNIFFAIAGFYSIFLGHEIGESLSVLNLDKSLKVLKVDLHNTEQLPFPYRDPRVLYKQLNTPMPHLVLLGVVLSIVSTFGILAMMMDSNTVTASFLFGLFAFGPIGVFVGARFVFTNNTKEMTELEEAEFFWKFIEYFNERTLPYNDSRAVYLEALQFGLKCCGSETYQDFSTTDIPDFKSLLMVPFSCCQNVTIEQIGENIRKLARNQTGQVPRRDCNGGRFRSRNCRTAMVKLKFKLRILPIWTSFIAGMTIVYICFLVMLAHKAVFGRSTVEAPRKRSRISHEDK